MKCENCDQNKRQLHAVVTDPEGDETATEICRTCFAAEFPEGWSIREVPYCYDCDEPGTNKVNVYTEHGHGYVNRCDAHTGEDY